MSGPAASVELEQLRAELERFTAIAEDRRSAYQKRRIRELGAQIRKVEKRLERAAGGASEAPQASPPATPDAAPATSGDGPALPERTDEQRLRDLATFLRLLFRFAALLAPLFGFRKRDEYRQPEAAEDATFWLELAHRFALFDRVIRWVAAPFVFAERIATKFEPIRAPSPRPATPAPGSSS